MNTLIHERVAAARRNTNPMVIGKLASGWVVLGDTQFMPGYSLLLPDPVVPSINALGPAGRGSYLLDMASLGDALLASTDAYRINYEILGNSERALHAHLFPRYLSEPEEFISGPVWRYPADVQRSKPFDPDRDAKLMRAIYENLEGASVSERGPLLAGV